MSGRIYFYDCFCLKICDEIFLKRLNFSTPRQSSRVLTLIQRLCLKNDSVSRCWCDISEATRIFLTTQYCKIKRTRPSRHVALLPRHGRRPAGIGAGSGVAATTSAGRMFANTGESFPSEYLQKKPESKAASLRTRRRAQDELKRARARFCCSWLVKRAVPIKCTSDLRRNQRSASNPSLLLHINSAWTKIYTATYSERKVMGGAPEHHTVFN